MNPPPTGDREKSSQKTSRESEPIFREWKKKIVSCSAGRGGKEGFEDSGCISFDWKA